MPARPPHLDRAFLICTLRRIPHEYLKGTKQFLGSALPDSPLLVFINSRSGSRAGARLAEVLCHAIGHSQVPKQVPCLST